MAPNQKLLEKKKKKKEKHFSRAIEAFDVFPRLASRDRGATTAAMDLVVLYLVAAAGLISLILLAVKLRGHPAAAAREQQNGVPARAVAHRPVAEDRGADMPRRRRNLNSRVMAQRRAQRDASDESDVEVEAEEEVELQPQAAGKVGAKKQRKLEEKQARKAQREAELEEREERRRMQELREQEKRKEDEKQRLLEQREVDIYVYIYLFS
uniref:DDRGK domain containing 1 n=1 Tax=Scleropages formosus TaxID=113540 RepID=A0A8C9TT22_SCLFO